MDTYRYREVVCVYIHERRISRGERAVCVQMITNLEAYQGFAGPNEWYMLAINDMYIMGVYFTAQCTYRVHSVYHTYTADTPKLWYLRKSQY